MFGTLPSGANAYSKVAVETGVVAASPHKLIVMLFDGALAAVTAATSSMKSGNIAAKGQSISKAIQIIENGLRASLDKDAGGGIAGNLDALYEYMCNRLVIANMKNQPQLLDEVHGLLRELREAWEAIGETPVGNPAPAEAAQPAVPDTHASHTSRLVKA